MSSRGVGPKEPEPVEPSTAQTPSKTDHKTGDATSKVAKEALGEEKQASSKQADRTYSKKPPLKEEEKSSSSSSSSVVKNDNLPLLPDIGGIIASFAKDKKRAEEEIAVFYESEPDVKRAFTQSQKEVEFSNAIREAISQAAKGKEFVFPKGCKGVQDVYQLDLSMTQVTKDILKEIIFYCPYLQAINLRRTKVGKDEIELLSTLKDLRHLNLFQCNNIDDEAISKITFAHLDWLDISRCEKVTGSTFDKLPSSLTKLVCSGCWDLQNAAITNLSHCKELLELDVSFTPLTGETFDKLSSSLTKLVCSYCSKLQDLAITNLSHCRALLELEVGSTSLTGNTFDKLPSSLTKLDCSECENLLDAAITNLSHCRVLSELNVYSTNLTGNTFGSLPLSLTKLACYNCCKLLDAAITNLSHCKVLSELNVFNTPLTGETFGNLPSSLTKLVCSHCSKLLDAAITNLSHCRALLKLEVGHTSLTGNTFDKLPSSLTKLVCYDCWKLLDAAITNLKSRLPKLRIHK